MASKLLILLLTSANIFAAGTDTHFEQEYRDAFLLPKKFNSSTIRKIQKNIKQLIEKQKFALPSTLKEEYYLEKDFHSYMFKDYYFDTPNLELLNSNAAYRLRYRWKNASDYFKYKYLPIRSYYPSRCEIQFKYDYNFSEIATMKEVRFEFRNDSSPFRENQDAPPPPWEFAVYEKYLLSGKYLNYNILPYKVLKEKLPKVNTNKLAKQVEIETIRIRNHINIKNIFGEMPNPDQIIIITFDIVNHDNINFLEVEFELDRSVGKNINKIIADSKRAEHIKNFLKDLKKKIFSDMTLIREEVISTLEKEFSMKKLENKTKYRRILEGL